MKKMKKILLTGLMVAMIAPFSQTALANEINVNETKIPETLYAFATIREIHHNDKYSSILIQTSGNPSEEILLNVSDESIFLDNQTGKLLDLSMLKEKEQIMAYYSPAMTRSIPPQSKCIAIVTNVDKQSSYAKLVRVGEIIEATKDSMRFLNTDGDFVITISKDTPITQLGSEQTVALTEIKKGDLLFTWVGIAAMSYPAQAEAESVAIVKQSIDQIPDTIDLSPTGIFTQNDQMMIPLRIVFEHLGFEVSWDAASKTATIDNGKIKSSVTLGKDQYQIEDSQEPAVNCGAAPVLINATTYVPLQFVEIIIGDTHTVTLTDGILYIYAK